MTGTCLAAFRRSLERGLCLIVRSNPEDLQGRPSFRSNDTSLFSMAGEAVELVIKNPSNAKDLSLSCSANATIHELQELLQRKYEGNPEPRTQTVSCCERLQLDAALQRAICSHGLRSNVERTWRT